MREARLLFCLLRTSRFRGCEAFGLFAARGAFSYVISALAVSHKTITLTLSRRVPSDFANFAISWPPGDSGQSGNGKI